jgi:A/G-specific adenine glycosylase
VILDTEKTIITQRRNGAERKKHSASLSLSASIRRRLAAWFRVHGRELPWRRTSDPYAVLVSEFMCQQTTVAAVVPYFERWMRRFPAIEALAAASEHEVLAAWQGLGYYARARNLLRAARAVAVEWGGRMPRAPGDLEKLPGVGRYTARAVAAFAFDDPAPVVDANVARVLARLHDYREPIDTAAGKAFLEQAAADLQPPRSGRLHNSAIMELGALVCRPVAPLCLACPIRGDCRAADPGALPVKRPRAKTEFVTERRAFVCDGESVFLARAEGSRWRGMWLLPQFNGAAGPPAHVETHPITRHRIRMEVVSLAPRDLPGLAPIAIGALPDVPIPAPHRRAIETLLRSAGLTFGRRLCVALSDGPETSSAGCSGRRRLAARTVARGFPPARRL